MSTVPKPAPTTAEHFWLGVLCLLGLDYFSTLAYQPSITFTVAGRLGPIATIVVALATLLGALPVYCYLAGRSPAGKGSLGLLERYVRGWRGKTLVLVLLGFAATDFIMLKTLSLSDAAVHVLQNPDDRWKATFDQAVESVRGLAAGFLDEEWCARCNDQLIATLIIGAISFVFWFVLRRGFNRNVVILAIPIVGLYVTLTAMIVVGGIHYIVQHPEVWDAYITQVQEGNWAIKGIREREVDWWALVGLSLLFLPNLALGLSGFEMSMILMPQVRGKDAAQRVANTRKVLIAAALIMTVFLLGATLVTTIFIPPGEMQAGGKAANRALAYLAHGQRVNDGAMTLPFAGHVFGGLYDLSTILMLAFAGTSVMTALAFLLPQFLLKFGMDFRWSQRWGVLLILFALINVVVTVRYQASVEQQRNAYATGVLVLIVAASVTSYLDVRRQWREHHGFFLGLFRMWLLIVATGFALVMIAIFFHAGGGLAISALFIAAIFGVSVFSRALRADELRTVGFNFKNDESKLLWDTLCLADFPILIPHRPGRESREAKETQIRREHNLSDDVELVFLEIELDDPSDFFQQLDVEVVDEKNRFIIRVTGCASISQSIASIALEMSRQSIPPGLHFGWPQLDQLTASWSYLAFGEGNIPWKVHELLARAEPNPEKRPRVIVG